MIRRCVTPSARSRSPSSPSPSMPTAASTTRPTARSSRVWARWNLCRQHRCQHPVPAAGNFGHRAGLEPGGLLQHHGGQRQHLAAARGGARALPSAFCQRQRLALPEPVVVQGGQQERKTVKRERASLLPDRLRAGPAAAGGADRDRLRDAAGRRCGRDRSNPREKCATVPSPSRPC